MTKLNPLKLLIGWTLLMIVLTPVFVYTSSVGSIGGEQKPLTTLVTMPVLTVIGAAVICIVTPFIFKCWLKANKWFIALAIFILIPTAIFLWQYYFETPYSYIQKFEEIDGNKFEIKTEYYGSENKVVRSNSFWKNGKRDSIWTVFAKDGTIESEKFLGTTRCLRENSTAHNSSVRNSPADETRLKSRLERKIISLTRQGNNVAGPSQTLLCWAQLADSNRSN